MLMSKATFLSKHLAVVANKNNNGIIKIALGLQNI